MNDKFPFSQTNKSQPKPYKMVSLNFFVCKNEIFKIFHRDGRHVFSFSDTVICSGLSSLERIFHEAYCSFVWLLWYKPINDIISLKKVQTDLQS